MYYVKVLIIFLRQWTNICYIPMQQYKRYHDKCFNSYPENFENMVNSK